MEQKNFFSTLGSNINSLIANYSNVAGSQATYNQAQAQLVSSNATLQAEYAKQAEEQQKAQNRMIVIILSVAFIVPVLGLAVAAVLLKK